jgi:hypothetical protein
MQMSKEELIFNVCRLSKIFNHPQDDMYCDLFENDEGIKTPPSQQLLNLYTDLRIILRNWFLQLKCKRGSFFVIECEKI